MQSMLPGTSRDWFFSGVNRARNSTGMVLTAKAFQRGWGPEYRETDRLPITRDENMRKPEKCPKCNSPDEVIPIKYGYPTSEMKYEWAAGKIELGGCMVETGNHNWRCKKCNHRW